VRDLTRLQFDFSSFSERSRLFNPDSLTYPGTKTGEWSLGQQELRAGLTFAIKYRSVARDTATRLRNRRGNKAAKLKTLVK